MKRFAVITGGTKGIGSALCEHFANGGYDIATCARSEADLKEMQNFYKWQMPNTELYVHKVDVSKKNEVEAFGQMILDLNRPIDVLVNNAGIFIPAEVSDVENDVLENLINTNLYSAYYLTRKLIPSMKKRKHGHIFNLCSVASIQALPHSGAYCVSKFALYGFNKVLRQELMPYGIKVTAVLPGATYTASWEGTTHPRERFIPAIDVADAIWSATYLSDSTVIEEILIRPMEGDFD
ncbi:MAG: SDR family oxidoreductase [Runella sp.]